MRLLVSHVGRAVTDVVEAVDVDVGVTTLESLRLVAAEGCLGVLLVGLGGIIVSILSCLGTVR